MPKTADPGGDWQKMQSANLVRYLLSGTCYARLHGKGKLIRRSLKTDVRSVAKLRPADFDKQEWQQCRSAMV